MFSFLPFILSIFTSLPDLIATAEKAFSGSPGSGEAKKKLVLDTTSAAMELSAQLDKTPLTPEQFSAILQGVSRHTDATVSTLNTVKAL